MDLTYQQLLAEAYDDNARNLLVHPNEYSDEEQDAYEDHDYEANSLPDKEDFNKFQGDRNKPEHLVKADAKQYRSKSRVDVRTIVLNIDGAFRGNVAPPNLVTVTCAGTVVLENQNPGTTSSHFTFMAHKMYRNITSVKMTSMEFSNTFYTFSVARGNTTFTVTISGTPYTVTIRDGNYKTPTDLLTEIDTALNNASVPGINIGYDEITHKFQFTGSGASEMITFPSNSSNPYANGIGYNLGFLNPSYVIPISSPLESDVAPDLVQDTYVYLQINDWNLLEHQQYGQTFFSVFAKIQLTGPKNTIIFDNNYTNSSTKEYIFQQPVNLQKFEIRMLDAYGNTLDLRNGAFSMTLELQQVNSSAVYEDLIKL
jgi:hypothetical protein